MKLYQDVENGNGLSLSIVTATGTVAVNTTNRLRGDIIYIYVKTLTAGKTFDFKLTDPKGRILAHYKEEDTVLREQVRIPIHNTKLTLTIENATEDNPFQILMRLDEGGS